MRSFKQQPSENLDYDFVFTDFLAASGDTLLSSEVTADTGLTLTSKHHDVVKGIVKVFITGGEPDTSYKVTCLMTSALGRKKEVDIYVNIIEL
jgi:hypothetical protein